MRLIRVGEKGQERPGLITDKEDWVDVSSIVKDYGPDFFESDQAEKLSSLSEADLQSLPKFEQGERLGAPLCSPSKIICIGLNFRDHAEESNMPIPDEPVVFFKSPTALVGPNDPVYYPIHATKLDWEVELAVVVGKESRYLTLEQANDAVFGYCLHNDVSERQFQLERSGQWVKGKSCDTFAPLGPFIATRDSIADVDDLDMYLDVNGQSVQRGNTKTLIFKVNQVVAYLSHFMTLMPGDVISMGTPPGVGLGMKPPKFLQVGDEMVCGIEGLGESSQRVVEHPEAGRVRHDSLARILQGE